MAFVPIINNIAILQYDMVATAHQFLEILKQTGLRAQIHFQIDSQFVALSHCLQAVDASAARPQNGAAFRNVAHTIAIENRVNHTVLHGIGVPCESTALWTNECLHTTGAVLGFGAVGIGVEVDLVAACVFPLKALHIHRVQTVTFALVGDRAVKIHTVDVGAAFVVEHKASTAHRVGDALVEFELSATWNTVFKRILEEIKVAICCTNHLMTRAIVSGSHAQGVFFSHTLVATFASFEIHILVGQIHFHHAHFQRHGGQIVFRENHARPHHVWKHESIHIENFTANCPLCFGTHRTCQQQDQRYEKNQLFHL